MSGVILYGIDEEKEDSIRTKKPIQKYQKRMNLIFLFSRHRSITLRREVS